MWEIFIETTSGKAVPTCGNTSSWLCEVSMDYRFGMIFTCSSLILLWLRLRLYKLLIFCKNAVVSIRLWDKSRKVRLFEAVKSPAGILLILLWLSLRFCIWMMDLVPLKKRVDSQLTRFGCDWHTDVWDLLDILVLLFYWHGCDQEWEFLIWWDARYFIFST